MNSIRQMLTKSKLLFLPVNIIVICVINVKNWDKTKAAILRSVQRMRSYLLLSWEHVYTACTVVLIKHFRCTPNCSRTFSDEYHGWAKKCGIRAFSIVAILRCRVSAVDPHLEILNLGLGWGGRQLGDGQSNGPAQAARAALTAGHSTQVLTRIWSW